jgi:hypothetical protein
MPRYMLSQHHTPSELEVLWCFDVAISPFIYRYTKVRAIIFLNLSGQNKNPRIIYERVGGYISNLLGNQVRLENTHDKGTVWRDLKCV